MSAIPSSFNTTPNQLGREDDGFSELSSTDFLEIIFAELQNQDPLSPNDTQALLDQISTIRSIESDLELSDKLEEITRRGEITSAGSLVGQFVGGTTASGLDVAGFVDSVSITREGIAVNLGSGYTIDLESVKEIVDPVLLEVPENDAPVANGTISRQEIVAGTETTFTFDPGLFSDPNAGDALVYSATQPDGSPLPDWVQFDPDTRTFTFEPGTEQIGSYSFRIIATDPLGASTPLDFRVRVDEFADGDEASG